MVGTPRGGEGGVAAAFEQEDAYLSMLLSYSLERLNKEPALLKADGERVQRQIHEAAVGQYRAFVSASECLRSVRAEVAGAAAELDGLAGCLPELAAESEAFGARAGDVVAARGRNRRLLGCHGTLLELLELPQLMDTCVRNGNYDEALDLEAFVGKLAVAHASVPVVHTLADGARGAASAMVQQLLVRLRGNVQLPECLRIVGYLRRMAALSEPELRLTFLRCREAWLAGRLAEEAAAAPYERVKRLTDCHRVHLFDVVMQYRAIFADDASAQETAGASGDGGLLHTWAMHRVAAYLDALREDLPKVREGGALASALEHCLYCGLSLGRVGLDLRPLVAPLFESAIAQLFAESLERAARVFERMLAVHRWAAPLGGGAAAGAGAGAGGAGGAGAGAPYALLDHPPVAVFANGVLAGLNEVRHCPLPALRAPCTAALAAALGAAAAALARHHATRAPEGAELGRFLALCAALADQAAPALAAGLGKVFPGGAPQAEAEAALAPLRTLLQREAAAAVG